MLEQHIKNANKRGQLLYASLLADKLNGCIQSVYELSEERLSRLHIQEGVVDTQIATLFDTDRREILQLRTKWDIKQENVVYELVV